MGEVHVGGGQCNVPEHEIKQNAGVSAQMALQAGQKAWELRQAAHGAGDAKAREEILAKAINKEIEAESFGKAAKYTQSGAFQGLAAGAGLGVQPGVTIGKLTGALVGGTVSTVTGLLGGGIGSVYGAMNGPMWDLGQMASQGVQGVVGDFLPDVKSTPSQKKALEKMVMQTKDTQAPSKEELEQMKNDAPDMMPQTWSQSAKDMTAWRPIKTAGAGIAGVGAAMNPWGVGGQQQAQQQGSSQPKQQPQKQAQQAPSQPKQQSKPQPQKTSQPKPSQPKTNGTQPPKQEKSQSNDSSKEPPKPRSQRPPTTRGPANPQSSTQSTPPSQQKQTPNTQQTSTKSSSQKSPSTANKSANGSAQPKRVSFSDNKENNAPTAAEKPKRKPRKLGQQGGGNGGSGGGGAGNGGAAKKAPRKLESRKPAAAA
ncbi:uncharacterized protein J4E79_005963 [Alternaria viburni]|uniref:uncharacterized protein n=1 Tax=Alternaria viburni TaxID=566460 RepID=UPI0020C4113E|nr:uncharacterized protein J4E79_005963 [Alternaria viburni]KAI4660158.1 hypothetical protein J4E79_005963 [Alternaria viburni]